jgi:hypothetical protein
VENAAKPDSTLTLLPGRKELLQEQVLIQVDTEAMAEHNSQFFL